jgi:hypothetical protein
MSMYPEIKKFVRTTLGCRCPEEVFDQIEYLEGSGAVWQKKINIGDRLLIYVIAVHGPSGIEHEIDAALRQGVEERDREGLNRFRLVLVSSSPDELRAPAEQIFNNSGYSDEKTHLHLIGNDEAAEVL